jgi:hypothetical protein
VGHSKDEMGRCNKLLGIQGCVLGQYESNASNFFPSNPVLQKAACITDCMAAVSSFSGVSGTRVSHMSTMHKQFKMADVTDTYMKQSGD